MARIAVGSRIKEGPRRGKVVAHRPQGMVDIQFGDVNHVERRPEARLRKGNPPRRENWAQVAVQIAMALLPSIIEGGKRQWAKFQTADRATQRGMVKKWAWAAGPVARAAAVSDTVTDGVVDYLNTKEGRQAASGAFAVASDPRTQKALAHAATRNPAGADDVYDPDKEQFRRVVAAIYDKQRKAGKGHKEAQRAAYAIATRQLQRHGYLERGTQTPRRRPARAGEKRATPGATMKRQRYEVMLSRSRKSGRYRVVPEDRNGERVYTIQPSGKWYRDRERAQEVADGWNESRRLPPKHAKAARAANPRRRNGETEILFYSSPSEQQLYALRLGKWYRLSMPRSREVFGPEAVEHILSEAPGEISTAMGRDEWEYLRPTEVPYSQHGPDETAHYRNPKRRKNWVPLALGITASVATLGDIGKREYDKRKDKKKAGRKSLGLENPRYRDERAGMSGYTTHAAVRNAQHRARLLGQRKGDLLWEFELLPPSTKQRWQDEKRNVLDRIEAVDLDMHKVSAGVSHQMQDLGPLSAAQKAQVRRLWTAYNSAANDAVLEKENMRARKKARRTTSPPRRRNAKVWAGKNKIGYYWADIRSAGSNDYMAPTISYQFEPEGKGYYLFVFDPGRGRNTRRGQTLANMAREAGGWKMVPSITNLVFADIVDPETGKPPVRYRLARLKKRGDYLIVGPDGRHQQRWTNKAKAQKEVNRLNRKALRAFLGTAGDPIAGYRARSRKSRREAGCSPVRTQLPIRDAARRPVARRCASRSGRTQEGGKEGAGTQEVVPTGFRDRRRVGRDRGQATQELTPSQEPTPAKELVLGGGSRGGHESDGPEGDRRGRHRGDHGVGRTADAEGQDVPEGCRIHAGSNPV